MKLKCILNNGKEQIINAMVFNMEYKNRKMCLVYRDGSGKIKVSLPLRACFVEQKITVFKSVFVGDNNEKFKGR